MFFEGSEKKVEVVLKPGPSIRPHRNIWERVVMASNAQILSQVSNEFCDAYLLSESSLFVYDRSLVMITCGTTSLVSAIEEMLSFLGTEQISLLMFERKNEHFPMEQPSVFEDDVERLRTHLPGRTEVFGGSEGNHVKLFHYCQGHVPPADDMTLELLMHDLGAEAMALFNKPGLSKEALYAATGIEHILEGYQGDDFLFDPVGYSYNGIKGDAYYTFHVTPEDRYSYASFETSHVFTDDLEATVAKVLNIFKPRHYSLVLFEQKGLGTVLPKTMANYALERENDSSNCGYDIRFRNYHELRQGSPKNS